MSDMTLYYSLLKTRIGTLGLVATDVGIRVIHIGADKRFAGGLAKRYKTKVLFKSDHHLEQAERELNRYFSGDLKPFNMALDFGEGTKFDSLVWDALRKIPYGETRTYKQVATQIGKPGASRAVGNACGRNPIAIIVPCHRVIREDGGLGGYGDGIELKRRLLVLEKDLSRACTENMQ
jgi:O-6-methylguanine DNA methyltransferase